MALEILPDDISSRANDSFSMENVNALSVAKDPNLVQLVILLTNTASLFQQEANTLFKHWTVQTYHKQSWHCLPK